MTLATDRNGSALIAGTVYVDMTFLGMGPISAIETISGGSLFVTKLGAWIESTGDAATGYAHVAALPAGNPVVAGNFGGTMNLRDSGVLAAPADGGAIFVAVLPP
jgi:hypothetical protein